KDKNFQVMAQLLGDKDRAERLYIATGYAISQVPALAKCSKESLIHCMMQSCYTGLFPGVLQEGGYLPNKGEATCIPRYGGLVGLAEQSGLCTGFSAHVVYETEVFDYNEGTNPYLIHKKFLGPQSERGERIAVYAACRSRDSDASIFAIMTMDEIDPVRARSQ